MSPSERRLDTRVSVRVPLRFRVLNNPSAVEETAVSENVSQRGVFFWARAALHVGTPVELLLRMPQEIAGRVSADVRCVARVVHVQKNLGLGGKSGIGLHIERYEAKAAVGSAGRAEGQEQRPAENRKRDNCSGRSPL